jgi:hypothetical protein
VSRLPGPVGSEAVRARVRQLAAEASYRRMAAEFQLQRAADQAARVNALIAELVHVLAGALEEDAARDHRNRRRHPARTDRHCRRCTRILPPRAVTCPVCGFRTGAGTGPPGTAAA